MGRTTNVVENPAVKTFKWRNRKETILKDEKGKAIKDEKGKPITEVERETGWYYWDKSQEKEIKVDIPFNFIWLESCTSFTGYNPNKEKGIFSNEVLNLKTQKLVVKCGDDIVAQGFYQSIKEQVKGLGGKYCQPVYALAEFDGEWEIVRFLMTGSSGTAWLSFSNASKNRSHIICCFDIEEKYTPNNSMYEAPMFKYLPMDEELKHKADDAYEEQVKPWFDFYLSKPVENKSETTFDTTLEEDSENSEGYY